MKPAQKVINPTNEFAKERNRAAAERTLLAWIRTSLSLISFGFGIDRVVSAFNTAPRERIDPIHLSRILGLICIAVGTLALISAVLSYRQEIRRIHHGTLTGSRSSLSFMVSVGIVLVGWVALIGLLL
jgi:putative membrane protein